MTPRFSPATFSLVFCCVYVGAFALNAPLFLYYPLHGDFRWGLHAAADIGPAMAWYGLMADAGVAATLAAVCVPDRFVLRALGNYLWVIPCAALIACCWFLRPIFA